MKTNRNVLLLLFLIQLITSCCNEDTYEVTITGLESRPLIVDGNNFIEFDDQTPIDKEDLIIDVLINEVEKIASSRLYKRNHRNSKVLEAAIVPCGDQIVVYKNKLESIKVEILDVNNDNERIDITNQLVIQGSQISISEYISENNQGIRSFFIAFSDTNNIPDRIEYIIEATLDDGLTISSSGGIINFK